MLTILGSGFSPSSVVTVDGNLCTDTIVSNFSIITCRVPPSTVTTNTLVSVVITDGSMTATAPSQFTYDVNNVPSITSFTPSFVTMSGGILNISGSGFGSIIPSVIIGTTQATVRSVSSTQIVAILPSLSPGRYPIRINTANGYARPLIYIEYRFYVQQLQPNVGSLYGGTDVYVLGEGFDETTSVSFSDGLSDMPCSIVSYQANQIHCRTNTAAPRVIISSNGSDPTYGSGFAWSPQYATVEQGAVVEWRWGLSPLLSTLNYRVQQIASAQANTAMTGGFDSGTPSSSGI